MSLVHHAGIQPSGARHRLSRFLKRVSVLLIEPVRASDAPELFKNNVLLLSVLLLIITPSILIASTWEWLGTDSFRPYLFVLAFVFFMLYLLNRYGYYHGASLVFIALMSALPFMGMWVNQVSDPMRITTSLLFILPAFLTSFLLLRLRPLLIVMSLQLALAVILPLVYASSIDMPQIQQGIALPLFILSMMAVMLLLAGMLREHSLQQLQQKQVELAESEVRFRDMFDATFEAILVHDKGIIVDVNPALERLLNVRASDVINRHVLEFVAPEHQALAHEKFSVGDEEPYEITVTLGATGYTPIEIRGKTHRYRGRMLRVVALRDITELRKAQSSQIDLAIEREKVNVLQRFISNMSHDLRTPLTVIKTSLYLIKRLRDQQDKVDKHLETLEAQVDDLQRLMDDLLSMSRLDRADTSEYHFKWTSINQPTEQIVRDQRGLALRRGQTLEFHAGDNIPNALIDETEYKRMIKHLILNGLGYTPTDGHVTVATYTEGSSIVISVRDTGGGINPVDLPFIFERFYRPERATAGTGDGGTGLGLNIARKIAEAHSGSIEAESELGKGSVFRVRLPIVSEKDFQRALSKDV